MKHESTKNELMSERLEVYEKLHPYGEQDSRGNSIASLRINLRFTPYERLVKADADAKGIHELHMRSSQPPQAP